MVYTLRHFWLSTLSLYLVNLYRVSTKSYFLNICTIYKSCFTLKYHHHHHYTWLHNLFMSPGLSQKPTPSISVQRSSPPVPDTQSPSVAAHHISPSKPLPSHGLFPLWLESRNLLGNVIVLHSHDMTCPAQPSQINKFHHLGLYIPCSIHYYGVSSMRYPPSLG